MIDRNDFGTERDVNFSAITKRIHKVLQQNTITNDTNDRVQEEDDTTTNTRNEAVEKWIFK